MKTATEYLLLLREIRVKKQAIALSSDLELACPNAFSSIQRKANSQ